MPTKLPSGKYRAQVFVGYGEDGKRKYKSFTADTAKKASIAALKWQAAHPVPQVVEATLSGAMDSYISLKRAVLSPSTIAGYASIARTVKAKFPTMCRRKLDMISQQDVQLAINKLVADGASPKTCRNVYGFLSAVYDYENLAIPKATLPTRIKTPLNIPDEETLRELFEKAKGTELEVPILLAAIGPMRRGEIVAATPEDLDGNVLHIHRAAVQDENNEQVIKEYPKTYESTRDIMLPDTLADKIREQGYVCSLTLKQLSDRFSRFLEREGFEHFRFHDLRHAFVSICHAAGVPDAYIQQRGGWATNYTMNHVYRHTLSDVQREENRKINRIFEEIS